jgi:hypothetical protein
VNIVIYKSFSNELEKQAKIDPFSIIGKSVTNVTKAAWRHPRTTLGLVGGAIAANALSNILFPTIIIGNQSEQTEVMNDQSDAIKGILFQEQLRNFRPTPLIHINKKIERPLV